MAKKEPSSLADAIRAQQAVVNQLADEHAEARNAVAVVVEKLQRAHCELTNLLNRQMSA
jgi:hypothetical protein